MKQWKIWFVSVFLLASAALGQEFEHGAEVTGRIFGQITEDVSGKPILGANVLLLGTMMGTATDREGRFTMSQVPPSTYTVMVSAIGYKKAEKTIRLLPGEGIELCFSLEETVLFMDGVAVTASRYQQSIDDIPISMSLVPAQEIVDRNITSVDQALRYVPGVNALAGGQIAIRGSSGFNYGVGSRVLVLLNGHPFMAGDIQNVNWYAIPTSNIKQIEVMKGSGSALYGSSAMGGVINIITEEPGEENQIRIRSFTGFYNRPSFHQWRWSDKRNHFEGTALDISTHLGPVSTVLSSNYQTTTGYKENDDHQIFGFTSVLGYNFNPNLRFDLFTGYGRNKGGFYIYWKDLHHPYANGSDPYGFHTRSTLENTYVFPSIACVVNNRVLLTLKGRLNNASSKDYLQSKTEGAEVQKEAFRSSTVKTHGGEVQLNCQVTHQGIMVVGCDFQSDEVEAIQFGHHRVSRASYYVQIEQRLWERLKATVGGRYDWEDAEMSGSTGDLSRKLGLNLTLGSNTNVRFSLGEGFRTPTIGERFVSTFTSGLRISPNPDLRPERSASVEMGIRQALTKSMNMDLAFFYNEYKDLIEPQLDSDPDQAVVIRFRNVLQARIRGIDLSHRTDWWSQLVSTRIGYTFLDSRDLSPGKEYNLPLKYRSKHTLYITNELTLSSVTFGLDFRYLSQIEHIDEYHKAYIVDIDKLVPTYVVALRFGISGDHYSFRFLIDNLFQYNYLLSPANLGPPRTAVLQLNLNS